LRDGLQNSVLYRPTAPSIIKCPGFLNPTKRLPHTTVYYRRAQILGARSPWRLNFALWRLISVVHQYGICFMSPSWPLIFWGGA